MELLGAALLIPFHVDDDVRALLNSSIYQHPDDELQVSQRFTAATDEQSGVFAFDLEDDRTVAKFVQDVRFDVDTHRRDEVGQDLTRYGLEFLSVLDRFDRSLFSPSGCSLLPSDGGFCHCGRFRLLVDLGLNYRLPRFVSLLSGLPRLA